ncbi:ORF40 [Spodoptera exigua multiple nucleopolyhedrovirus]|uniref:Uncharacterized protein n=2 Tax=Spodoptera exigua multiple nucleopolyhedrovirus TaxID=10454 RepID=A0A6N0C7G7_9ABAC|nr:ORF40 [Spodoptera exigua multiple nucleopolyhedrovirus]AAF33570.1 ORF40 [Spodoptera exigua multiple nucleopolyhedrovirus]QKO28917.1 hypothetical protein [Spodoptera exigua multiple nucleopolyhedrovirus]UWK31561.1 hypothetical protein [Spodoptera exigua multiple nucleopolyhedrovirus]
MERQRFNLTCDEQNGWYERVFEKFGACYYVEKRSTSLKVMIVLRLCSILATAVIIAAALYDAADLNDFMLYYSHWSLATLMLMYVTGSITTLMAMFQTYTGSTNYVPFYTKIFDVLYNIACTANILSTIVYFITTFTYAAATKKPINHVVHSLNTLLVLVEVMANAVPMRLFRVYQPMLFTIAYGAFAIIYHYYTGTVIYKYLQWEDQREISKLCISAMILMFAIYMILYVISFIKNKMLK